MPALRKVTDREKLKPRNAPYFQAIEQGKALGFRKLSSDSTGTWIARWRDSETHKQHHQTLGPLDHLPLNRRYDAALEAAREWWGHLSGGGAPEVLTVKEACERYAQKLQREKGTRAAGDTERRFRQYVYGERIAKIELQKLTRAHVTDWRKALEELPTELLRVLRRPDLLRGLSHEQRKQVSP